MSIAVKITVVPPQDLRVVTVTAPSAGVTSVAGMAGVVPAGTLAAALAPFLPGGATVTGIDGGVVGVSPPPPPPPPPPTTASLNFALASNSQYIALVL